MKQLAFRNIIKNKTYSFINIIGLSIGFVLCYLVFSVIIEENSYDKSWSKSEQIYRIITEDSSLGQVNSNPQAYINFGYELQKNFPEIQSASHIRNNSIYLNLNPDDPNSKEFEGLEAEENVFDLLDIHVLEGTPKNRIAGKRNIMISKSFKDQYFPNENVIGKILLSADPYAEEQKEYIITGVMADLPYNSVLRTSIIQLIGRPNMPLNADGGGFYFQQFIHIKPGTDIHQLTNKVNKWYREFLTNDAHLKTHFSLQPLTDIYLDPLGDSKISGNPKTNLIFLSVALLVLVLSCINYINIYAVRTIKKVKSIHLHKVLGAKRSQLIKSLLLETSIIFGIAGIISFGLFLLILPVLTSYLDFQLVFVKEKLFLLAGLSFFVILLLSLIIGCYPAFMISNIKTADALRNKIKTGNQSEVWIKRGLITLQFSISLIVIIGLITIKSQISLVQHSDLGIKTKNILGINYFSLGKQIHAVKAELEKISGVEQVSITRWVPSQGTGHFSKQIPDPQNESNRIDVNFITADQDLPDILGFKLLKGRNLTSADYDGISEGKDDGEEYKIRNVLLTEGTAKRLGITELGFLHPQLKVIPVGIIADFHSQSLHKAIGNTAIVAMNLESSGSILIKLKAGQEATSSKAIGAVMDKFYPNRMLTYEWIDDLYQQAYAKETKQAQLFTLFSGLALFISALGITGLLIQSVEQRSKEIGIRKVLGASIANISNLFAKDYVLMVLLATLLASPLAWYLSNKWLEDFAYKIEVKWWFFALSGLTVLIITLITVNLQTIRAAMVNPVKTLRDE